MIDKVQKIRKEVEKLMYGFNLEADIASCEDAKIEELANIKYQICKKILDYIDEVQKETVSEKKCIFTKDSYTDEDRKVLCEDCKEKCVYSKKLKIELNKYIKDNFTIDTEQLDRFGIEEKDYMYSMDKSDMLALVEHFTNWEKIKEEFISEDLEEAVDEYAPDFSNSIASKAAVDAVRNTFKAGAKWQFEKINEILLSEVLPCFMHGGEADEVVAKLDEVLNHQKK